LIIGERINHELGIIKHELQIVNLPPRTREGDQRQLAMITVVFFLLAFA